MPLYHRKQLHFNSNSNNIVVYILKNTPPGGEISAGVIWGKNMKAGKRKRGKFKRKRGKKKEERKKTRKGGVKG